MTTKELVVTQKGQVTIPIKLRRKFGIKTNSKVEIVEEDGKIVIKKLPSFLDLVGSGAKEAPVKEVKRMLDEMRAEDAWKTDLWHRLAIKSDELRAKHTMPMADGVIAATAQIEGCPLFSDDAHFENIENLKLVWCK